MKKKTVYCLRIRGDDSEPWSEPTYYRKQSDRNVDAMTNRILGGLRTHSYEEKVDADKLEELCPA